MTTSSSTLCDKNEYQSLELHHYSGGIPASKEDAALRGTIYHQGNVYVQTHPYIPDLDAPPQDREPPYYCMPSIEGTLLRLYPIPESHAWALSTHRRLDAYQCKWGSKYTFGEQFEHTLNTDTHISSILAKQSGPNALQKLASLLDPEYVYTFVLSTNTYSRLVCQYGKQNKIYFMGKFKLRTGEFTMEDTIAPDLFYIPHIHPVETWNEVLEKTNQLSIMEYRGMWLADAHGKIEALVYSSLYKQKVELRGNEPNLLRRYVQLRNCDPNQFKEFVELYSKHIVQFNEFEERLFDVQRGLCEVFVRIFIRHEYSIISPKEYRILKQYRNAGYNYINLHLIRKYMDNHCSDQELLHLVGLENF